MHKGITNFTMEMHVSHNSISPKCMVQSPPPAVSEVFKESQSTVSSSQIGSQRSPPLPTPAPVLPVWASPGWAWWSFTALKSDSTFFKFILFSAAGVLFCSTPLLCSLHWHFVFLEPALWDIKAPTSGSSAAHLRSLFNNDHARQSGQPVKFFSAVCIFFSCLYTVQLSFSFQPLVDWNVSDTNVRGGSWMQTLLSDI